MTSDEVLVFVAARREAWRRRDADALAKEHADLGTVESPMFAKIQGRNAIRKSYESLFQSFPDWTHDDESPLVDGDRMAWPFVARATHSGRFMGLDATGRRCEIHGVSLMDVHDGLIAHERRIYDFTGLLIQLGVLRGKPGT